MKKQYWYYWHTIDGEFEVHKGDLEDDYYSAKDWKGPFKTKAEIEKDIRELAMAIINDKRDARDMLLSELKGL